jgi:hypothetical protein
MSRLGALAFFLSRKRAPNWNAGSVSTLFLAERDGGAKLPLSVNVRQ